MNENEQLKSIIIENWSSVFNTILGNDVKIAIESAKMVNKGDALVALENFTQSIRIDYGDDADSFMVMAQNNRLISIVSNLMVGLDSFGDEINDDDRDAFSEAVNQMFSSCQVPLMDALQIDVKFKKFHFINKEQATDFLNDKNWIFWTISITFPDISKEQFALFIPEQFIDGSKNEKAAAIEEQKKKVDSENARQYNKKESYIKDGSNIDLLMDVELPITIRIGSTEMKLIDIMRLGLGSIIELEKLVDDPVEVLVNSTLVAKGEVVVYDSNFAIRITHVESRADRIRSLG